MAHELIMRYTPEPGQRVICISDIHGHLALLDRLLEKIDFSSEDLLIIIGDAVESGEASLGALRRVMELVEGGNAIMLAGNWDYYMYNWFTTDDPEEQRFLVQRALSFHEEYGSSFFWDMCAELGITLTPETDIAPILPLLREKFPRELEFLRDLPIILDCGGFVCVHGGVPTLDEHALAEMDPYEFLKNDAFAEQGLTFDRWVITGHWPVANYDRGIASNSPHIFPAQKIAAIDGGCGKLWAEQLNALIFRTGEAGNFTWEYVDALSVVTALEAQSASADPLHTIWTTRFIDVLEDGDEFTKIRHLATGKVLDVPTSQLWVQNGRRVLGDYTDYVMPVAPGDMISVLRQTSRGLYGKKDGVCGWYCGRYEG